MLTGMLYLQELFSHVLSNYYTPSARLHAVYGTDWVSERSHSVYPSSAFTACVHDVAIGLRDVCISDFWVTTERIALVPFGPTLWSDDFYLLVGWPFIFYLP